MGRAFAIGVLTALTVVVAIALFDRSAPAPTAFDVLIEHPFAEIERDVAIPELPFPDNPDPTVCGKPERWLASADRAWLTGYWEGDLVEPQVVLYESHLRTTITGSAPHGSEVRVVLSQSNPVLDFYFVEVEGADVSGWVPAPFLSFDRVEQ